MSPHGECEDNTILSSKEWYLIFNNDIQNFLEKLPQNLKKKIGI